jgi:hypothetical protein
MAAPISIGMNELSQLASAMLVLVFAAAMLVARQMYVESAAKMTFVVPVSRVMQAR